MQKLMALAIFCCSGFSVAAQYATAPSKPFVLGRVEKLYSQELSESRILNIYLPPGYSDDDTAHYPVIYLLDGGADEDFIHIVGLVQFNSFAWINRLPACIVVGIANKDRKRDFTFPTTFPDQQKIIPSSGGSAAFISFLAKEVQPFIRKKYRGNGKGLLIGQSLGGLLATEILLKHTALFDKYIIISPSLWWDRGSLLESDAARQIDAKAVADVFIAVGKEGLTPGMSPRVMEVDANRLADQLKSRSFEQMNIYFHYLPGEDHGTIMHQAVSDAFRVLYPLPVSHSK